MESLSREYGLHGYFSVIGREIEPSLEGVPLVEYTIEELTAYRVELSQYDTLEGRIVGYLLSRPRSYNDLQSLLFHSLPGLKSQAISNALQRLSRANRVKRCADRAYWQLKLNHYDSRTGQPFL